MKNILDKLAEQADELDELGHHQMASGLDSVSRKLAEWTFMGGKSAKTPEERARHRLMLGGDDDETLYQKFLAEEKAKDAEQEKKKEPKVQPVLNYTKKQLMEALKKKTIEIDTVKSHLVPALNVWINDNKTPAPDVYGMKDILEILDVADKVGMLKRESGGFFSKLFD